MALLALTLFIAAGLVHYRVSEIKLSIRELHEQPPYYYDSGVRSRMIDTLARRGRRLAVAFWVLAGAGAGLLIHAL